MKKWFRFNNIFVFTIGRNSMDAEKSVLPTILYINTNHPHFADSRHRGFVLVFGWWDFSIKVGLFY